jgi:hypothetical protein
MLIKPFRTSLGCLSLLTVMACGSSGNGSGPNETGLGGTGGRAGSGGGPNGSGATGSGAAGSVGGSGGATAYENAGIRMRMSSTTAPGGGGQNLLAFAGGGAVRPGLENLEYFILGVQICESMDVMGSGFSNPGGCLDLYRGDEFSLNYDLTGDWTPLADAARGMTTGFIDLLDPASRETLNGRTELTSDQVRSYNYGIITWSLPIKVKATIPLGDGTFLYTHDGATTFETLGADNFRHYFTTPSTPMTSGPAEKAVVLLGNGGNWFKFQNPLTVTQADIDERRQWVLDLVFNPEGIVKGFAGDGVSQGSLQERSAGGSVTRAVTVPMLDLAPIPHREAEQVVRESYLASVNVGPHAFDLRLELYSIDGDPAQTIYGADVKTLVTAASTSAPPEMSKVSFVVPADDGGVTFQSFNQSPIISGFRRVTEQLATTTASIKCATHGSADAAGGAAIVLDSCPSADIEVTFRLVGRTLLDGELPDPPSELDGGTHASDAAAPSSDAGPVPDAGPDAAL